MRSDHRRHWTLAPGLVFLNHGSYGACPRVVLERQSELRAQLEASPVQFMLRLPGELQRIRQVVAPFLGAEPENLAFVGNATEGVNAVIRSLPLAGGDQILASNHAYPACLNALRFAAEQRGASVHVVEVPFPIVSAEQIVEAFVSGITPRTRLALVDHVTSATALVFPVAAIARVLRERGVRCLVDGAHAAGMLELNIAALGADYYALNFHKWTCAPKGAGALWVASELRNEVYPTVISHGLSASEPGRFHAMFDWTGTSDPTAWLCIDRAIEVMAGLLPGGWPELRAANRRLALRARDVLCSALGVPPPAPDELLGAMATIPLPPSSEARAGQLDPLYLELVARGFELPVFAWPAPPQRLFRVSAQLYNSLDEYEQLARALRELGQCG